MSRAFIASLLVAGCSMQPQGVPETSGPGTVPVTPVEIEETVRILEPANPARKKICRIERPTGSHMARKRCFTPEEREKMAKESRDWVLSGGRSGSTYEVKDDADPRE